MRARAARSWLLFALLAVLSHRGAAQVGPTSTLTFSATADTYVDSGSPTTNFNSATRLRASGSPTRIAYLRFVVSGVAGRRVQTARLRLHVLAGSPVGGTVHLISNHSWSETAVTYKTRPAIDGPVVATLGAVTSGATAEFVLDGAIAADGTYDLAIDSTSSTAVDYDSNASTKNPKPSLVLTVADQPPTVTIVQPPGGAGFFAGDAITLQATARDAAGTDLSSAVAWTSDVAGPLGRGAIVSTSLAAGAHTITASVTDGRGLTGSAQSAITVAVRPPGNTEPLVAITAPTPDQTLVSGAPITFTGTAHDLEDGDVSAGLVWTSDRDGLLGTGGSVRHALSVGTHAITATVTDAGGLVGSATRTLDVRPGVAFEFPASADVSVDAGSPTVGFGASPILAVDANVARTAYLRFDVSGLGGRTAVAALVRVQVDDTAAAASDAGGALHAVTDTTWTEGAVTFATRPAVDGPALATAGAVSRGQTVEFDASPAVTGEGAYAFAIVGTSADECDYRSRESGAPPTLVVYVPGEPPSVTIAAPADHAVVFVNAPVTFTGQATDLRDGDLSSQLQWTSSPGGPLGTGATIGTSSLSVGTHVITAAATNADGLTGEAQISLQVRPPNQPPQVAITSPADGTTVQRGLPLTLAGTAVDDFDGDIGARLRWTSSRDGALATRSVTLSTGAHVITASATDSDGATGSAAVHVTVAPSPPTVTIGAPADGTVVFAGTPVTFDASATDPDDGNLSGALRWFSDRDGLIGSGPHFTTASLSVGHHTLSATVTDAAHLSATALRTLVVRSPNTPPALTIVAPAAGTTFVTGKPVLLSAVAFDVDDGDLSASVVWSSSRDGALGTGGAVLVPSLSIGAHTLTAAVTDRDGATSTGTVAVNVLPQTLAVAASADTYVDASAPTKTFGTSTTLWADASPAKLLFLRFPVAGIGNLTVQQATVKLTANSTSTAKSNAGGVLHTISSTTWSEASTSYATRPAVDGPALATQGAVAANQVVSFDVTSAVRASGTYNFGLVTSSSDEVVYQSREATTGQPQLVLNLTHDEAPVVWISAPASGTKVAPGTAVVLRGGATDAENGRLDSAIAWSSSLDGALGTGPSVTTSALRSGVHTITATVTDSAGLTGRAQITLEVLTPPAVRITAPADHSVFVTTALPVHFTGTAIDLVDGDLSGRLQWRSDRDGALATGAAITASALSVGTHAITASATDDNGLESHAQIVIRVRNPNQPPQVTIAAPAPGTAVPAGTPITLTAAALDDFDGDLSAQIHLSSSRDGALGLGPSRTVTLSEGAHTLVASVTDSDGATGSASVGVTITPSPPVVSVTSPVDGARVFVGTAVAFNATAIDATDGDLSTRLRWTSSLDGPIGTGASFSTTHLSAGTHVITAAATDNGGLTAQVQRTVVIRPPNVPPTIAIRAPTAGATLLDSRPVLLGATATDPEDGDLSASVRWSSSRDGALGTGATVVVAHLSAGAHVLTASVTDLDGATRTATVNVTVVPGTLTFAPVADTYVDGSAATTKFGTATSVFASGTPVRIAYFRFAVSGVGGFAVQRAIFGLTVGSSTADGSAIGGTVHAITNGTWSEGATTFKNRPAVDGVALSSAAKVVAKQAVAFDVTTAVRADGTYNFALDSTSSDSVKYGSREASTGKPQLVLTLTEDMPPLVTITAPAGGSVVDAGRTVTLTGTATDAENGDLSSQLAWRSDRDGALGTGAALAVATLTPGRHTITASVTDSAGHLAEARILLAVATPPALAITAPADGSGSVPGAVVSFAATASDVLDGDVGSGIAWTSSLDGALGKGATLSVGTLHSGTHVITASVADSAGKSSQAAITLVVNAPPTVAITAPADGTVYSPGDTVALVAAAHDVEDGNLDSAVAWSSSLDGPLGTGGRLEVTTLRSGRHTVTATVTDRGGKRASASIALVVNAAPTLQITAPGDGSVFSPGDVVHLAATAHDAEDGDLTAVAWSSSLDGTLGTGRTLDVSTLRSGTHVVTATVTDSGGKKATATIGIVVNAAPTVAVTAPANGTVFSPGDTVHLAATAHDLEDGDLTAVAWSSSLDGSLGTGRTLDVTTLRSGTHTITATVTDHGGKQASASIAVVVNAAPTVGVTAPANGAVFSPGDTVHLVAVAHDLEDGDLTAVGWTSDLDGGLGTGTTLDVATLRSGTHTITAAVTDSGGKRATASIQIVVNAAPTVAVTGPADGTVYSPGDVVHLRATAQDLEDGPLTAVQWTSSLDGPLGAGLALDVATLRSGTHTITAAVTDRGGKQASAAIGVVVNAAPTVSVTGPADGSLFAPGDTIHLVAAAHDAEDGDLTAVRWTSDLDGPLGTAATLDVTTLRSGTHAITAAVTDSGGKQASTTIHVVVNAPPTVTITAPADRTVYSPGDVVHLTATAHDLEDGDLTAVGWSSDLDGALGSGRALDVHTLRSGTHVVTAAVSDAGGRRASASITVVVNAAPTVTIGGPADGTVVSPGDVVHLVAVAHDAEDGDLTAVRWTSDLQGSLGTGVTLDVTTLRSGTHTITAAVTDSGGKQASASIRVTVNAAPTLTIDAPADGSVYSPGDAVHLAATARDLEDGDLGAAVAWSSDLDGALGTGPALAPTTLRSGTHAISARVVDTGGKVATAHVTVVVNAAPTVQIDAPADGTIVGPGDLLHLAASATDLEDGNLGALVVWSSSLDGPLGSGATLDVAPVRSGTHTITATVTDRGGKSTSATRSVVVDAPPRVVVDAPAAGTLASPGDLVTFSATATDREQGDLSAAVTWTSDLDGPLGAGAVLRVTTLRSGTHHVTAAVADAWGRTATALCTVVVNAAPTIAIDAPADNAVFSPGDAVGLVAGASDLEDGDLGAAILWTSDLDGPLGTGPAIAPTTLRSGTHHVTATVADHGGRTASATRTVIVNAAPTLRIDAPGDGAVFSPGDVVSFAATASDVEDGNLGASVVWTSDLDGSLGTGAALSVALSHSGTHHVTATVADRGGKTVTATRTVLVNAAPTLAIAAPAAGTIVSPGDLVTFVATATDREDGNLGPAIAWSSDLDGPLGTGSVLERTTLRSGVHHVTATVADAGGKTASAATTVVVDAVPVIAIVAPLDGTTVPPGSLVGLVATATDLEDGDLGAAVVWSSDLDGPLGGGAALGVALVHSGVHHLLARVVDANGRAAAATRTITVNAPPTLSIGSPADGTIYAPGDLVPLAATAADYEQGDLSASVSWTSDLDGPLGTGAVLAVPLVSSGTHHLTAVVADASGATATATCTVVVNAAPSVAIATPADGAVFDPGAMVSLAASATDREDGDLSASVVWTSDLDGPLGSGATLAVTTLRSGLHHLTATVFDSGGKTASATRTVLVDAAPTVTLVGPPSGSTYHPQDLVTLTATASDLEDGDLGAQIAWSSNLAGALGSGATVSTTALPSGTHTITATVVDAGNRGASATVTVVVGPLVTLHGTYSTAYNHTMGFATLIDALGGIFLGGPSNHYPLNLSGADQVIVRGGSVLGQYDRSLTWSDMHAMNNAAVVFSNANLTVDGVRIDNVTDGIRPQTGDNFTVRNVWGTYVRDDCIENDHLQGGLVDDTLFDGCYVGFSARPSQSIIDGGYDGRGKVWTIQNTLVRLQPTPDPAQNAPDGLGNNVFFKWHKWTDPANSLSPKLALYNNIFMAERAGIEGMSRMGVPPGKIDSCANNVIVWLGPGDFTAPLPAGCFTITKDRSVWDAAVADWKARHPNVGP